MILRRNYLFRRRGIVMKKYQIILFDLDGTLTDSGLGITNSVAYTLDHCEICDKSEVVMIGDREYDIIGAKEMGIDSIGVLFEYGSRKELEDVRATYIAEEVKDIENIIFPK